MYIFHFHVFLLNLKLKDQIIETSVEGLIT